MLSHNNTPLEGHLEGHLEAVQALIAPILLPDHAHGHPGTLIEVAVVGSSMLFLEVEVVLPAEVVTVIRHALDTWEEATAIRVRRESLVPRHLFPGNGSRTLTDKHLAPLFPCLHISTFVLPCLTVWLPPLPSQRLVIIVSVRNI